MIRNKQTHKSPKTVLLRSLKLFPAFEEKLGLPATIFTSGQQHSAQK